MWKFLQTLYVLSSFVCLFLKDYFWMPELNVSAVELYKKWLVSVFSVQTLKLLG